MSAGGPPCNTSFGGAVSGVSFVNTCETAAEAVGVAGVVGLSIRTPLVVNPLPPSSSSRGGKYVSRPGWQAVR